ncbi:MAG: DUF5615 family PIN-like protein [Chitinophagales bacterium]|nr:DUF5615 family PIN-like protein [Chitinophagales bacterium]
MLDECVTKHLKPFLSSKGHDVITVSEMKWNGIKNGELLKIAEASGFEILLTIDKNIKYQQSLSQRNIVLVIFDSFSSSVEMLRNFYTLI